MYTVRSEWGNIRDIHHRHETVENPVRPLQLNGLWEQTFSVTKQENTKISVQAYCTPPESNLLSWLDNVFIGFQVLDSFFSFSSPINIVEFNEKQTVASPCKSLEGRLIESGKTFSFYISEPLHYEFFVFVHLRTSPYAFNLIYYCQYV